MKNKLLLVVLGTVLTAQALVAQVPSYVPTNGLVGYWPFNGNANDVSGNGNNGTVNGATLTTDRNGNANSAYSFDGVDDRIFINNSIFDNGSNFTFSGWYFLNTNSNPNNGNNSHIILNTSPHNGLGIALNWGSSNKYSISVGNGAPATSWNTLFNSQSNQNIEIQTWKFITLVKSSNTYSLYVNGVIDQTWIANNSIQSYLYKLYFGGCDPIISNEVINGNLDDIGIWNRALTQQEITNLYNVSLPQTACLPANVPTSGLMGYWPFCGNANDDSGNGNNGTVYGATLTTDRFGNANSAYSFDGNSNKIEVNDNSQLQLTTFSVSLWVNATSGYSLVNKSNWSDGSLETFNIGLGTNLLNSSIKMNSNCFAGQGWNNITTITGSLYNSWKHIVVVFNGSDVKHFVNGVQVNSQPLVGLMDTCFGGKLKFGAWWQSAPDYLNGKLDDIGICNRALTQQEITNLYNANQCITNITITDTLIINVGQLSFTNPVTWANNITIAPNPASTEVNINFNNITNLAGGSINIINALGQSVATTPITVSGTNTTLSLATWGGTGMYFVQIINPQGQIVDIKKIILQ
jgi:hypothetical protein